MLKCMTVKELKETLNSIDENIKVYISYEMFVTAEVEKAELCEHPKTGEQVFVLFE